MDNKKDYNKAKVKSILKKYSLEIDNHKEITQSNTDNNKCLWVYNSFEKVYRSSCKELVSFLDGKKRESKFKFCPCCGLEVIEV